MEEAEIIPEAYIDNVIDNLRKLIQRYGPNSERESIIRYLSKRKLKTQ